SADGDRHGNAEPVGAECVTVADEAKHASGWTLGDLTWICAQISGELAPALVGKEIEARPIRAAQETDALGECIGFAACGLMREFRRRAAQLVHHVLREQRVRLPEKHADDERGGRKESGRAYRGKAERL